jgi:pimeloyl-ACP methyl ester carboxylesterase
MSAPHPARPSWIWRLELRAVAKNWLKGTTRRAARRLPDAELVVFENSAHMTFAEEQDRYPRPSDSSSTASPAEPPWRTLATPPPARTV